MEHLEARFVSRDEILGLRARIPPAARFEGLWAVGNLEGLARTTVAIVGSRAPSEGGRSRAHALGAALAARGICVISGLALGIDGAAHAGAVSVKAPTIGVLGGGHRCFFPRRNRSMAEAMIACGGAVMSPFPPDHPALPAQFLQRNGIVAALADAVVIVEAAARSGALNTASWAADLGIPVLAFPGDVDRPKVAGCLALIRDGATLVRNAEDVLADIGLGANLQLALDEPGAGASDTGQQSTLEARMLETLVRRGESDLEDLLEATGSSVPEVLGALTRLEIAGRLERRLGNRYAVASTAAGKGRSDGR